MGNEITSKNDPTTSRAPSEPPPAISPISDDELLTKTEHDIVDLSPTSSPTSLDPKNPIYSRPPSQVGQSDNLESEIIGDPSSLRVIQQQVNSTATNVKSASTGKHSSIRDGPAHRSRVSTPEPATATPSRTSDIFSIGITEESDSDPTPDPKRATDASNILMTLTSRQVACSNLPH